MRKRFVALLACALAALLLLPATAFAQDFTPNARLDDDGVLHWDAEGEYYSRIDLFPLMFGPSSADYCVPSEKGEYTYDIENLFQAAEQFYGAIGTGDVSGLNGDHPVTFVYYEKQADGTMQEVGKEENAYSYSYTTGQLVQLDTPSSLTWTDDGFTASWSTVANAAEYRVTFYETTTDGTREVGTTAIADTSCKLTSVVTAPKDGATYAFDVRAWGPEGNFEYRASKTSAKSAESNAWQTPVVEYGLFVGGVEVTSENAADVLGDGTVSYDPNTQTLKLNGANITQGEREDAAIYFETGNLSIELVGDNVVAGPDLDSGQPVYSRGICVYDGTLNISGDGGLTVEGGDVSVLYGMAYSYGIWAAGNVDISSGTVTAAGGTVANSNGTAGSYGISANQDIIFSGGTVEVTGGDANTLSYGAYAANGSIAFTGGSLTATSGQVGTQIQPKSHALYGYQGVTVSPQEGEMILVAAGMAVVDAVDLEDSPFREETAITDAIDGKRCVFMEATESATRLYELRVQGGTGGGMYAEGTKVTISAVEFDEHGHFTGWYVVDTGGGDFEDWRDATTIFTMPANDTNVVAGYDEHSLVHHDAKAPTCTEPGWEEYVTCEGCAYTTYKEIPATGHTYEDGTCVDCGEKDPDYVAPEDPAGPSEGEPGSEGDGADDGAIPATGDAAVLAVGIPAALGAVALVAGAVVRRRR